MIVHAHWIDLILSGTKSLEIRSQNIQKTERIALATTKPYVLIGDVELVNSTNISHDRFKAHAHFHCVDKNQQAAVIGQYKTIYAWQLRLPRRYETPIEYRYSPGQVIWVKLHTQQHIFASLAAEQRQVKAAQDGIGDLRKADDTQESARTAEAEVGSPNCGATRAPKLREEIDDNTQQHVLARLAAERRQVKAAQHGIGDV